MPNRADLAPPGQRPLFLGVWRVIADSGGMLAPAVTGAIAAALSLGGALYASAALSTSGALAMLRWPPRRHAQVDVSRAATSVDGASATEPQDTARADVAR